MKSEGGFKTRPYQDTCYLLVISLHKHLKISPPPFGMKRGEFCAVESAQVRILFDLSPQALITSISYYFTA
jgi:hypothetical protein